MRIGLVGGVFGSSADLRRNLWYTPETILQEGLGRLGHETAAISHYQPFRASDFDIVHVHHLSFGAVRAACSGSRTPLVFTVHSSNRRDSYIREGALRFVLSRADAVVSLSRAEFNADASAYDLQGAIHRIIPNGIDAGMYRFAPKPARDPARPWIILCVAHLTPMKGHAVLFRALTHLPPAVELQLVYHGDALLQDLQHLAVELGVDSRVRFLGAKNPNELRDLYQRADLFVLSSFSEALPSVVTEAMLCGTPVVGTDVGGVREQIGCDGIVVPPGDSARLALAIRQIIDEYPIWISRAERVSDRTRDKYSTDTMVKQHLQLYRDVIEQGSCRRSTASAVPANAILGAIVKAVVMLRGNPQVRS